MKIQAVFSRENTLLYEENLSSYPADRMACKRLNLEYSSPQFHKIEQKLSKGLHIVRETAMWNSEEQKTEYVEEEHVLLLGVFKGKLSFLAHDQRCLCDSGRVYLGCLKAGTKQFKMEAGPCRFFQILLSKTRFLKLFSTETWCQKDDFHQHVQEDREVVLGKYVLPMDVRFHQLVDEITQCEWEAHRQKDFVLLKLKELWLTLHYQKQQIAEQKGKFSGDQLEKLRFAQTYLLGHYTGPPTIKELSRIVLLNESQLKKGFKTLYGKTIGQYVIDLRMKKALTLLERHQVNEMAELLGYKSVSHFINTFKKFYGESPKRFLHRHKLGKE